MNMIAIVILAGGNSRRMGSPKALLPLPNAQTKSQNLPQTLLDFHISHASMLNLPILIGDNGKGFLNKCALKDILFNHQLASDFYLKNATLKNLPVIVIDDYIKNAGALSCLLSAFDYCHTYFVKNQIKDNQHISNKFLMVIGCDNLINVSCISNLLNKADLNHYHGAYLKDVSGDKDYPLLGCYSLSLYDELKVYLNQGERSVMRFLKDKSICQIPMPSNWKNLANFNTPDEFKLALSSFEDK